MNNFPSLLPRLCLVAVACLVTSSCKRRASPTVSAVPVYTAPVVQQTVALTRSAVGLVQPLHAVALQSQVDGVIAQIHFTEGAEVTAGTLLVTLDQRPFQNALRSAKAQLEQARANAEKAEADFQRYARLHDAQAISDSEFAQYSATATGARATVAVQDAAVAAAELNLDYTEIRAPIAGRTSRNEKA